MLAKVNYKEVEAQGIGVTSLGLKWINDGKSRHPVDNEPFRATSRIAEYVYIPSESLGRNKPLILALNLYKARNRFPASSKSEEAEN